MHLNRQQIVDILIGYYYMIDLHYSDCKDYIIYTVEEIEERCEYLENILNYMFITGKHMYRVNIDYIRFGGFND